MCPIPATSQAHGLANTISMSDQGLRDRAALTLRIGSLANSVGSIPQQPKVF
jgi:hypothetical protein